MPKNILITGGAGFIGSRLVTGLIEHFPDAHIWVFDNLHPQVHGVAAEQPNFPDAVEFIKGDVTNKEQLELAVDTSKPDMIYHLAAETGTGQSYDEVARYCDVNVTGTANLIEAIRSINHSKTQKIVLASSRAVYGEGGYQDANGNIFTGLPRQAEAMQSGHFDVPLPSKAKLPAIPVPSDNSLEVAPASIYASTKMMQEYIITQCGEGAKWQATILRLQNVYGPGQSLYNPYTGVLSIFTQQLLSGKRLEIYEDGNIARDFVFIDDVVRSLIAAGTKKVKHGAVIDIGSGQAITILDTAKQMGIEVRNLLQKAGLILVYL